MSFKPGQFIDIRLKDGRKVKGEVGSADNESMVLWNAEVTNIDGTTSIVRVFPVAFRDIEPEVEQKIEEKVSEKTVEEVESKPEEKEETPTVETPVAEKPRRRRR